MAGSPALTHHKNYLSWFVIKTNIIQIRGVYAALLQGKLHRVFGKRGVVLLASEPFFLCRSYYLAVLH